MAKSITTGAWFRSFITICFLCISCGDRHFNNPVDPDAENDRVRVVATFEAPCASVSGIAWDGENVWVADAQSPVLYAVDRTTGGIIKEKSLDEIELAGIAFAGSELWAIDLRRHFICQFDMVTGNRLFCFTPEGVLPWGIESGSEGLWVTDSGRNKVYLIDKSNGSIIREVAIESSNPYGITRIGDTYWIASPTELQITAFDMNTGNRLLSLRCPGALPLDLTWDGFFLWHTDAAGVIFKLELPAQMTERMAGSDFLIKQPHRTHGSLLNQPLLRH